MLEHLRSFYVYISGSFMDMYIEIVTSVYSITFYPLMFNFNEIWSLIFVLWVIFDANIFSDMSSRFFLLFFSLKIFCFYV